MLFQQQTARSLSKASYLPEKRKYVVYDKNTKEEIGLSDLTVGEALSISDRFDTEVAVFCCVAGKYVASNKCGEHGLKEITCRADSKTGEVYFACMC